MQPLRSGSWHGCHGRCRWGNRQRSRTVNQVAQSLVSPVGWVDVGELGDAGDLSSCWKEAYSTILNTKLAALAPEAEGQSCRSHQRLLESFMIGVLHRTGRNGNGRIVVIKTHARCTRSQATGTEITTRLKSIVCDAEHFSISGLATDAGWYQAAERG